MPIYTKSYWDERASSLRPDANIQKIQEMKTQGKTDGEHYFENIDGYLVGIRQWTDREAAEEWVAWLKSQPPRIGRIKIEIEEI